ncbi:MAG: hypothetical protein COC19_03470 [SAR86 cluster bacterium]|uniref:Diguanylate cyclase n=1 Tax=SAR86 cluster bacterium TaxID=2030880 RepID=A0A2A4MR03_9GAMM|nr:MAG: hypothetical protein COC19_03470 [SAR86 cluster bacterium]
MSLVFRKILIITLLVFAGNSWASEKVSLQLKWQHDFRSAGYYAALWQGFYEAEELDVSIVSSVAAGGSILNPVEEIIRGRAQIAIGGIDILVERGKGKDLVILAPIFQHMANSLFSLEKTQLDSVQDLGQLRIAADSDNYAREEVEALIRAHGVEPSSIVYVSSPATIESLLDGTVDVIVANGAITLTDARERNLALNQLSPGDYGLQFYGDTLFSHGKTFDESSDMLEAFLRASIRGWEYALSHKAEMSQRISLEFPRDEYSYEELSSYNFSLSDTIEAYMDYPLTEIGHSNKIRWVNMIRLLQSIGVLKTQLDFHDLVYIPDPESIDNQLIVLLVAGMGVLSGLVLYFMPSHRNLWPLFLISVIFIVFAEQRLERNFLYEYEAKIELDMTRQLNYISSNFSGMMSQKSAIINGLVAHIVTNPELTEESFERYSRAVFSKESFLKNIAVAPDLVISMIYPLKGNEAAMGFDYERNELQSDSVRRAVESKELIITGPVQLVQGGSAFIGREAVFINEKLWGIVSATLSSEVLYRRAGLLNPDITIDVTIRGGYGLYGDATVFYGDEGIFSDPRALNTSIVVGEDNWYLAANPKQGWNYVGSNLWLLRFSAIALLVVFLLYLAFRQRELNKVAQFEMRIYQNESLLRDVGKMALIGGWRVTSDRKIVQCSEQAAILMGVKYGERETIIDEVMQGFPSKQAEVFTSAFTEAITTGAAFDIEIYRNGVQSEKYWLKFIGDTALQEDGRYEVIGAVQNISERKVLSEVIQRQATFDLLTDLPNRFLFNDRLNEVVHRAARDNTQLAVLFVDLDKFKPVNDSLGHQAGDEFLKMVAARMQSSIRVSDTLARYSGDEFTIILQDITSLASVLTIVEKVLANINKPYTLNDMQIFCSASIGIAMYPEDALEADDLVSMADHAMYEVKLSGGNGWHFFTKQMQEKSKRRHFLHNELQQAVAKKELDVFYQPIVNVKDQKIVKYEALVRWFDKDGNLMPTEEFISIAEESGLINEIDRFVLKKSSDFLIQYGKINGVQIGLTVNLSPRIFTSRDDSVELWLGLVRGICNSIDLTVEITERLLTQDTDRALDVLQKLKTCGASVAIDDFGTGYSSLSYLTKFPIDYIKIDRSFIQNLDTDPAAKMLTDTIINLAKKMQLQVIAEGVEKLSHFEYLAEKGCEYAQGYYLGRPQSEQSLLDEFAQVDQVKVLKV